MKMKFHIQTTQMLRWVKTDLPKPGDIINLGVIMHCF